MASEKNSPVAVVMGSDSDLAIMQSCIEQLGEFGIKPVVRIISAHRTPQIAADFADKAAGAGIKVIIAAAGMAAHLAGVVAAETVLPVIAVPLPGGALNGVDALYAMVQMPGGIPVATMAIGKAGAKNAGLFAVQMLALVRPELAARFSTYKQGMADEVAARDAALQDRLTA